MSAATEAATCHALDDRPTASATAPGASNDQPLPPTGVPDTEGRRSGLDNCMTLVALTLKWHSYGHLCKSPLPVPIQVGERSRGRRDPFIIRKIRASRNPNGGAPPGDPDPQTRLPAPQSRSGAGQHKGIEDLARVVIIVARKDECTSRGHLELDRLADPKGLEF